MSSVAISGLVPAVRLEPYDSLILGFLRALRSDRDELWLVLKFVMYRFAWDNYGKGKWFSWY